MALFLYENYLRTFEVYQKDLVDRCQSRELANNYLPLTYQNLFILWLLMFFKVLNTQRFI